MANVKGHTDARTPTWTLDTTNTDGTIRLGDAAGDSTGTFAVQVEGTGWTGSITIKARVRGSGLTRQPIPYRRLNVGGTVSDNTYVSAAITGNGVFMVEADGLDVSLDYTHTGGSVVVAYIPMRG